MDPQPERLEEKVRYQRREIEGTLDEIGDRVSPRGMYERQRRNMRDRVSGWKERLMGSSDYGYDDDYGYGYGSDSGDGGSSSEGRLSQAADAVSGAPDAIRRQTRGNPLAAGLVAFGAGLLAGSVLPETETERRAVREVEPQMRRAAEEAKEVATQIGEDVKESAQQQAEELKETARESVEQVKENAQEGAEHVRDDAQGSAKRMQS